MHWPEFYLIYHDDDDDDDDDDDAAAADDDGSDDDEDDDEMRYYDDPPPPHKPDLHIWSPDHPMPIEVKTPKAKGKAKKKSWFKVSILGAMFFTWKITLWGKNKTLEVVGCWLWTLGILVGILVGSNCGWYPGGSYVL